MLSQADLLRWGKSFTVLNYFHHSDPLFQRTLVRVLRRSAHLLGPVDSTSSRATVAREPDDWSGLPVIFDEVFTGLFRLGRFTPSSFLGVHPDISVHAKLLTGGLIPLSTTLASEHIFRTFCSQKKTDALLHGHSYTAHPVGCQVALESLRQMQAMEDRGEWDWAKAQGWAATEEPAMAGRQAADGLEAVWSIWPLELVEQLSRQTDRVAGVWALGSVLAIHLKDAHGSGYSSNAAASLRESLNLGRDSGTEGGWNVHARVLGNVLYMMASQTTNQESIHRLADLLRHCLLGKG